MIEARHRWAAAVGLTASILAHAAGTPLVTAQYGPFTVRSDGRGQKSSATYAVPIRTTGELRAEYRAPASHCSSLKMHFLVDGVEKAVSGVIAPGGTSGVRELGPLVSGTHVLEYQAEGVIGGCNTGTLLAWGGDATVWTSAFARDPAAPVDTIAAGCGGGVIASGDEVIVSRDGSVERRGYRMALALPPWRGRVAAVRARDLLAHVNDAQLWSTISDSSGEAGCHLTIYDGASEHEIRWSMGGADAPARAKAIFDEVNALAAQAIAR